MGKKTRKTRWRTLAIADESDSEESNTLSGSQLSKNYHHRPFYSKFTHSSQSTPTRRFPYETKSTRSSSTASENKITFNEDEYTKITTPRQDVLFKKGYLSKPKNYQTQTSTGNSTASTGNSTGNGTPDHQSADGTEGTDLEYESQFVFPNAFVDQNGIYYINSYEHYPMVLYNPPICYPEYPVSRTKRHSTGSLTESTSPHTEETSQDLSQSGGENTGNGSEFNHVYNIIYPGYYFNGACNSNVTTNGHASTEPRKIKKKRRRKISKSINQEDTTSSEDGYSSDEAITQVENRIQHTTSIHTTDIKTCSTLDEHNIVENLGAAGNFTQIDESDKLKSIEKENSDVKNVIQSDDFLLQNENESTSRNDSILSKSHITEEETSEKSEKLIEEKFEDICEDSQKGEPEIIKDLHEELEAKSKSNEFSQESKSENKSEDMQKVLPEHCTDNLYPIQECKFNLNAQEFVPRAYRNVEPVPVDSNLQFINIHPNFVPLPLINHSLNELTPPPFNQPFLPPGIPFNFVATDPKLLPNFVNLVPNHFVSPKSYEQSANSTPSQMKDTTENDEELKTNTNEMKSNETDEFKKEVEKKEIPNEKNEEIEKSKPIIYKNDVDIAKIVSKLEEAAKEQKLYENRRHDFRSPSKFNKPKPKYNNEYQNDYKQNTYRSNLDKRRLRRFDNKPNQNIESKQKETTLTITEDHLNSSERFLRKSEEIQTELQVKSKTREISTKPNEERKYSPRHQSSKHQDSPKRYINYNRNTKNRSPDTSYSATTNDYSDTLKKSFHNRSCPRYEKYASDRTNIESKQTPKKKIEESIKDGEKLKTLNLTNQWISVSNRKKRKNRSINEDDVENIKDNAIENIKDNAIENSEVFEKSNELLQSEEREFENISTKSHIDSDMKDSNDNLSSSIKVDNFIEMIANSELSPISMCSENNITDDHVLLQDIKDIEQQLLKESVKTINGVENDIVKNIPKIEQNESLIETKIQKEILKKKKGKGVGKNSMKRIIILDPDISKEEPQKKDKSKIDTEKPVSKQETKISVKKTTDDLGDDKVIDNSSISKQDKSDNNELIASKISLENASTPEKKKNKKKKKQLKPSALINVPSISSSSTTLNNIDDSYDFLLDTTTLIEEKTNVEVSEELDKMIHRGLFGNLEEKFKSLNVSVDNDFFKSLSLKSKPQSTPEKGFIKATNFTTILNHVNQPLPKAATTEDQNKIDIDFSKIKLPDYEPQPSTSKTGDFLERPLPNEIDPPEQVKIKLNSKSNGKLKNKSKKLLSDIETNNTPVLLDEKYFTNNERENDIGESILSDIFQENGENNSNIESDPKILGKKHIYEASNQDNIEQNKISAIHHSNANSIQTIHLKSTTEILVRKIQDDGRNDNADDALDIEIIAKNECEENLSNDDIDQTKILNDEHIIIKIENMEPIDRLENTLTDQSVITKVENKSTNDNHTKLLLKNEESPKSFSDTTTGIKPLYPITQAVKEWMSKTRETTPEIEILKSPDTIYKEFIENSDEENYNSDTEVDQKNGKSNPSFMEYLDQNETCHISMNARVAKSNSDNEVTVCETWSMSQDTSIQEDDLLDCWEPDIAEAKKEELSKKDEPIEEGEDVLEVYESKYGKNEDFLRLKTELEEHKRNGTFPKHSNLPYRAICCSLM